MQLDTFCFFPDLSHNNVNTIHIPLVHRCCSKWSEPFNCSTWTGPASRVFKNITWSVICTVQRKHGLLDWKSQTVLIWHGWIFVVSGCHYSHSSQPTICVDCQAGSSQEADGCLSMSHSLPIHFSPGERCCHSVCQRKLGLCLYALSFSAH